MAEEIIENGVLIKYVPDDNQTSVTISDEVTSIGFEAFSLCENLVEINLPERLTSIGLSAFSGCTKLSKITIPATFNIDLLLNVGLPENVKIKRLPPKLADQGVPQQDSVPQSIDRLSRNIYYAIRRLLRSLFNLYAYPGCYVGWIWRLN